MKCCFIKNKIEGSFYKPDITSYASVVFNLCFHRIMSASREEQNGYAVDRHVFYISDGTAITAEV